MGCTYDKTLENSDEGCMRKLSSVLDQVIKCRIFLSSNMLDSCQCDILNAFNLIDLPIELVNKSSLHHFGSGLLHGGSSTDGRPRLSIESDDRFRIAIRGLSFGDWAAQ